MKYCKLVSLENCDISAMFIIHVIVSQSMIHENRKHCPVRTNNTKELNILTSHVLLCGAIIISIKDQVPCKTTLNPWTPHERFG